MIDVKGVRIRNIGEIIHVTVKAPLSIRHAFRVTDLRSFSIENGKLFIVTEQTDMVIPTKNWGHKEIDRVDNILTQMLVHPTAETCSKLL